MKVHHLGINGERLRVREAGSPSKPSVFWFHSLGTSSELWAPQLEALQTTHHLIAMDCRGHGSSSNRGGFFVDTCADDALAVLREMKCHKVHIVGLSMGGLMAAELAARMQEAKDVQCESIVLACSYRAMGGLQAQARIDATRAMLAEEGMTEFARLYMEGTASEFMDTGTRDHMAAIIAGMWPDDYGQAIANILNHDAGPALARVCNLPTLVLSGKLDKRVTPEVLEQLIEAAPQAQKVELEKAGHLANIEDPKGFTQALLSFWASVSATAR